MAERARREVDAGDAAHVRVITEWVAEAGVLVEQLRLDVAALGQQRVDADRDMSLGQDQPIAFGPVRILRQPHHSRVQGGEHLGRGIHARVVAAAGDVDQPDRLTADQVRSRAHLCDLVGAQPDRRRSFVPLARGELDPLLVVEVVRGHQQGIMLTLELLQPVPGRDHCVRAP